MKLRASAPPHIRLPKTPGRYGLTPVGIPSPDRVDLIRHRHTVGDFAKHGLTAAKAVEEYARSLAGPYPAKRDHRSRTQLFNSFLSHF